MAVAVSIIATSSLGDRSYLATDGEVAVVIDPQRDIDRVLTLAGREKVRITHVAETHLHNDYVSGGRQLAQLTGAQYLMAAGEEVGFDRVPVSDGDVVALSDRARLRVLATPGHTPHHVSYVLDQPGTPGGWAPAGIFTGGSLLFGTTGRTDLLGPAHARELAHQQHASAQRLADLLPDGTQIWPTHGFGSYCSARQADAPESTIGRERGVNPVLRLAVDEFVAQTIDLDDYPAYYAHLGVANAAGPAPVDLTPVARAEADELRERLAAGQWVVDLRHRRAYATAHLVGAVSLGLDGPMSTWLGWLINWGTPVTLLAETPEQIAAAQRELARIGIDRPAAAASGQPEEWAVDRGQLGDLPVSDFAGLAAARNGELGELPHPDVVLDVRIGSEWRAGHLEGAVHIPLYALPDRMAQLPDGAVWVHCSSGYRSAAAASLLANARRQVVLIDDLFSHVASTGLSMATGG